MVPADVELKQPLNGSPNQSANQSATQSPFIHCSCCSHHISSTPPPYSPTNESKDVPRDYISNPGTLLLEELDKSAYLVGEEARKMRTSAEANMHRKLWRHNHQIWRRFIVSRQPTFGLRMRMHFKLTSKIFRRRCSKPASSHSCQWEYIYWLNGDDAAIVLGEECGMHGTTDCFCLTFYDELQEKDRVIDLVACLPGFVDIRARALIDACLWHKSMDCYCRASFIDGHWYRIDVRGKTKTWDMELDKRETEGTLVFQGIIKRV